MRPPLLVLGPQRPAPNLVEALDAHALGGTLLACTAGWRHDESEVSALRHHVRREVRVLPVYAWFERLVQEVPQVARAWKARQTEMRASKELYRIRLRAAVAVVRELWARHAEHPERVDPVLERAVAALRQVDADALADGDAIRARFPEVRERFSHPAVAALRDEARAMVEAAGLVGVAGGNVGVLRSRLLFFDVDVALREVARPIVAWGGGAMVLAPQIVLYYDDSPEGPQEAELLDTGLGLLPHATFFPHARVRLDLDNVARVATLARRFGPDPCVALENGAWLERRRTGWRSRGRPGTAFELRPTGELVGLPEVKP